LFMSGTEGTAATGTSGGTGTATLERPDTGPGPTSPTSPITDPVADGTTPTDDEAEHGHEEDEGASESQRHRQFREVVEVGQAILSTEYQRSGIDAKLSKGEGLSLPELALSMYHQIDSGDFRRTGAKGKSVVRDRDAEGYYLNGEGEREVISFIDGNPIVMPRLTEKVKDEEGKEIEREIFADGDVILKSIVKMTKDGKYLCEFGHPGTGDTVMSDDPNKPLNTPNLVTLDRQFVASLQTESEIEAYRQVATENPAYQAYLDAIASPYEDFSPSTDTDSVLESGATTAGLPTRNAVTELIENKYPDAGSRPDNVIKLFEALDEGGVVLRKEDFKKAMEVAGVGTGAFQQEIDKLLESYNSAEPAQQAEIKNQINLLTKLKNAWMEAEKKKSPIDLCYEEMRNGRMNFSSFAEAIVKGNAESLMKFLSENPNLGAALNLSEEQQRVLAGLMKDHKGGLLWALIVALGIPIAIMGGTAMAATKTFDIASAASGGHR
jgi:hypothetical protein